MNDRQRNLWVWLGACSAAALLLLSLACDPGHTVTFENRTNHTVTVLRGGVRDFVLGPSETAGYTILEFAGPMIIEARDESGRVIHLETLTWEELERMDWKIVITESVFQDDSSRPAETSSPSHPFP
jgi:hypothetical protein